ncbi:MAG: sensor histidine kinase [Cytophagia bacterium]|nr:sensor histidine kinase [Cytophagia bacterium]NBW36098.1 sensor histidine kinase [Cytophagia bacterium]
MKPIDAKLWIVTSLAMAALLILLVLQVRLLNQSIETNRQVFSQKINIISEKVTEAFRANQNAAKHLPVWLHNDPHDSLSRVIHGIVGHALIQYRLPLNYEYGIYVHEKEGSDFFRLVSGSNTSAIPHVIQECDSVEYHHYGFSSLTCGYDFGDDNQFHLAIIVDEEKYLTEATSGNLIVSALLAILLCLAFLYMIYLLRRQRKISEIKDDFINNLTHEFKTPIFSIELATGILKRSDELKASEKLSDLTNLISTETQRLKTHVDKILQMALMDSGNFRLEKRSVDLHELIESTVHHFKLIILEKRGFIKLDLKAKAATLHADDIHLRNVITNLIDNAIKFSNQAPFLSIATTDADNGILLSIRDSGIGMSTKIQQLVFQRFYRAQTGNVHNTKGFGLGLNYVKQIIDAHKGTITLKSKEQVGSEFIIYLPAY